MYVFQIDSFQSLVVKQRKQLSHLLQQARQHIQQRLTVHHVTQSIQQHETRLCAINVRHGRLGQCDAILSCFRIRRISCLFERKTKKINFNFYFTIVSFNNNNKPVHINYVILQPWRQCDH